MWTPKDIIVMTVIVGVLLLLGFVVAHDFMIAVTYNRAPDESVIEMIEKIMIGVIGIIGGYFAARSDK